MTIKEISKLAGASVSTVSRVLNDSGYVSASKRQAIEKVIRETNYRPSMIARSLQSQQTKTLAVILPDVSNPYFISLIEEIGRVSEAQGYAMILINTMSTGITQASNHLEHELRALQTIQTKQVDGAIIIGGEIDHTEVNPDYLARLNQLNETLPIIIIGQKIDQCHCTFIERHIQSGMRLIVQHMFALGHRHLGFLGGKPGVKVTEQRLAEFQRLTNLYATYDPKAVLLNDYYIQDGYNGIEPLLQQAKPDAVLAINDQVARGAIRRLHELGVQVPTELAIGSADRFPGSEYDLPSITTVDQHNNSLGKLAVEQLIRHFNGQPTLETRSQLPDLIIRESCGEPTNTFS
ncbi:substrate-binding domain-containing protein [Lactiplantibacillus mudanjiangensis]|uniref:substrate-binding domain-containing protein n=1 Tax=Lactiplantibacillus mudanjiangensis TaxID=1296538 RepID=UPI00102FDE73